MAQHLVFVYGSLMAGLHNHRLLARATFRGRATVHEGTWRMIDLGAFPGIVADPASGVAPSGELWAVDDETLAALDRLEGHPTHYRRTPVVIDRPRQDGLPAVRVTAGMYVLARAPEFAPTVAGGDWRAYLAAKTAHNRRASADTMAAWAADAVLGVDQAHDAWPEGDYDYAGDDQDGGF